MPWGDVHVYTVFEVSSVAQPIGVGSIEELLE